MNIVRKILPILNIIVETKQNHHFLIYFLLSYFRYCFIDYGVILQFNARDVTNCNRIFKISVYKHVLNGFKNCTQICLLKENRLVSKY